MRRILIAVGVIGTVAMLAVSMRLNYLFGYSLGQTPERAQVFAWVSMVADCWKAIGPIFLYSLTRSKRWVVSIPGGLLWIACFCYAVSSALGLAVQDRTHLIGGRETLRAQFADTMKDLAVQEAKLDRLPVHQSARVIDTVIDARLSQAIVPGEGRNRTVSAISSDCSKPDSRTASACADVSALRLERAIAIDAASIENAITDLKARAGDLRNRGATLDADPQAELLSRLTLGWLPVKNVGLALVLTLALVIELISAFGLVIVSAYCDATSMPSEPVTLGPASPGRRLPKPAAPRQTVAQLDEVVLEYMAERLVPASQESVVGHAELFADFEKWCRDNGIVAQPLAGFITGFERLCRECGLLESISKHKRGYKGLRLQLQAGTT